MEGLGPGDHHQRKQLLYEKFGAQVEAVLAAQPELLQKKDDVSEDRTKQAHAQVDHLQLELLLRKKGVLGDASSTTTTNNIAPVQGAQSAVLSALTSTQTSASSVPSTTQPLTLGNKSASIGNTQQLSGLGQQATQLDLLLARKGLGLQQSHSDGEACLGPLMTQQFAQVDLVINKLRASCVKLELENQVLNDKLAAAQSEMQRKDERIRALERELSTLRPTAS